VARSASASDQTRPLGPAHDGAREVTGGGRGPAAGQDEVLERRQRIVEAVERLFELRDAFGLDHLRPGNAQLAAEIEQVVLDLGETARHPRLEVRAPRGSCRCSCWPRHRAVGLDTRGVLADPLAVAETGGAVIARARVDLAQAMSHGALLDRGR
jgi:hypothetical protein